MRAERDTGSAGGQGTPLLRGHTHTDLPLWPQGAGLGDGTAPPAVTSAVPAAAGAQPWDLDKGRRIKDEAPGAPCGGSSK